MPKQSKILLADDEQAITVGLEAILTDAGYEVEIVADGQKALDAVVSGSYGVLLADFKMPKLDGLAVLKEIQARELPTECIIITGQGSVDSAVEAMRQGAYDFIEKPLNAEKLNRLKAVIPKALEKAQLQQKNRELATRLENLTHYGELTGQSDPMRVVYDAIEKVAPSTASVLILGESGTGKELVARAVHSKSERAKGPFFALNCAALPKEILENELFGHEKGAFTGSTNEKAGAFEMSSGGTIFLDEVAEMSPDIQVKLLRALETRMVRRLGGKREIAVDIRIVAATNKDLEKAIAEGELREDLYYRLAVFPLYLPPLRERAGDVKLLAEEFLARFAAQNGKRLTGFDEGAMNWIMSYNWPGNVRELKNNVERAVIMTRGPEITYEDIAPRQFRSPGEPAAAVAASSSITMPVGATLADMRRQMVLKTFAASDGDVPKAARTLGIAEGELRAELAALLRADAPADPVAAPNGRAAPAAAPTTRDLSLEPSPAVATKAKAKRAR
jgi:DNA-binding NtrC family response regulator